MKLIITSALPYSYGMPHLGNFVGSVLPADVYYKYTRMREIDSIFICGSDQHGSPIELRAIKEKVEPSVLAERMHKSIKETFGAFGCSFTHYGSTHSESNKETVYEFFAALQKNGYIEEVTDTQAYCKLDKRFLTDRLIEGTCPYCKGTKARGDQCDTCGRLLQPNQIINPLCKICGKGEIEFRKVKNLAISLQKLQDKIEEFVAESSKNNWSKNAANKSISYIKEGLKARDITWNMRWGFPVPAKGFEESVFYVWFDALIGYIGMTREWSPKEWGKYWKDPDTNLIHFMGKDNIEFHTTIWPGILIGSGLGYTMPKMIRAAEFLTSKDVKFSKSSGVGLDLAEALKIMDPDYWRFVLMYLYPETADAEFTVEQTVEIVNKLMNGKIGNLIHRVLTIVSTNPSSIGANPKLGSDYSEKVEKIIARYMECFERIRLREALSALLELSDLGNTIMSKEEPWMLAKKADTESQARFRSVMESLMVIIYSMSVMLWPFTPTASERALGYIGEKQKPSFAMLFKAQKEGVKPTISKEFKPLFSKLVDEQIKQMKSYG
jgi:methionyl-tRNA synthetase